MTNQLLRSICAGMPVDPRINNLTPYFAATHKGANFVVECTVAQESDQDIGATKREERTKKAIDSVDTGRFRLSCQLFSTGTELPPTGELCRAIKNWLDPLDSYEERRRLKQCYSPRALLWSKGGWELQFEVIHADSRTKKRRDKRAIQMDISDGGWRQDDASLKRAFKES